MSLEENLIEEARAYAISEIEKFGTSIHIYFEIAEKKAVELAEKLNADVSIVKIGSYFMDLKLSQALKENRLNDHVSMSVDASMEFLKKFELDSGIKEKIINCIEAHHGAVKFKSIEAEICANADCYKFIHPKGFFAYLVLLGKRQLDFNESLNQAELKLDEKYKTLSLDICKNELGEYYRILKGFINDARKF